MNALPNLGTRFGFQANSRLSSFLSWWQGELAALAPASAHGILLSAGKCLLLQMSGDEVSVSRISGRKRVPDAVTSCRSGRR